MQICAHFYPMKNTKHLIATKGTNCNHKNSRILFPLNLIFKLCIKLFRQLWFYCSCTCKVGRLRTFNPWIARPIFVDKTHLAMVINLQLTPPKSNENSNNWKNPLSWFGSLESQEFFKLTKPLLETCAPLCTAKTMHTYKCLHQHDSDEMHLAPMT